MAKKVNIIGAGLAGLSTGIYLQQSGVDTEIYELAGWAGGVCTAWVRGGYRFDGCIHWMVGTKSGDGFYEMYQEVGALNKDTAIYNADSVFMELGGVMYEVPMQVSKFRAFLHGLSVQDEKKIDEFCDDILLMSETKMPAGTPKNLAQAMKIMKESKGFLILARKYLGKTVEDIMLPIQSKAIHDIMFALMPAEFSAQALVMMLGTRMGGTAGYPMGGALETRQPHRLVLPGCLAGNCDRLLVIGVHFQGAVRFAVLKMYAEVPVKTIVNGAGTVGHAVHGRRVYVAFIQDEDRPAVPTPRAAVDFL